MGHGGRISWGRLILGGLLALGIAGALLALIGPLVAMRFTGGDNLQIGDDAMAPVLLPGDWVLAEALSRGQVPPRGAIVVYRHPLNRDRNHIMRVMGLPGERIQMRGGALYVDGQRAGMERLEDRVIRKRPPGRRMRMPLCINDPVEVDGECRQERWRETLADGTSTIILNTRHKIGVAVFSGPDTADDTGAFNVPGGQVFVLGDHRDNALDSRDKPHGLVPI
ncbi:MAG: signal peptidase I, partial [Proteobacteria bacterium]|nr:signal peptidase I [Pseudomonadota bacterium]